MLSVGLIRQCMFYYITVGLAITELGETCKERGWIPLDSLSECIDSIDFVKNRFPKYPYSDQGIILENDSSFPEGCYLRHYKGCLSNLCSVGGYYNLHAADNGHVDSRAICKKTELPGKKLYLKCNCKHCCRI